MLIAQLMLSMASPATLTVSSFKPATADGAHMLLSGGKSGTRNNGGTHGPHRWIVSAIKSGFHC